MPKEGRVVGCKWVFKKKLSSKGEVVKYKARLVAQGFSQIPGIDFEETFSPVVRYETIRILLAHAVHYNMIARQLDMKTAFLNGDLDKKVYMKVPDGLNIKPGRVCCLKRSIYGLKQSPRQWNQKLVSVLIQIGLKQSSADPCMFATQDGMQIVAIYVDDILVLGSTEEKVEDIERLLTKNFEVTFLGIPRFLLSIQITWFTNYVTISQEQFIYKMLEKYDLLNCKPVSTPMDCGSKPEKAKPDETRTDKTQYQSKVGSLLYLAMGTRPDIAYTVNVLSQFSSDPTVTHHNMIQHLLRYLKGSMKKRLIYKHTSSAKLIMYSDASYANSVDDRRSYSGYIGLYGNAVVSWSSKKQQSVAVSTTEAEYMALSASCRQVMWMSYLLKDFNNTLQPLLLCDNQATIHLSNNPALHRRSKHIDVHYHYVRERIIENDVIINYVTTKENIADLLTKAVGRDRHEYLSSKFMVSTEGEC